MFPILENGKVYVSIIPTAETDGTIGDATDILRIKSKSRFIGRVNAVGVARKQGQGKAVIAFPAHFEWRKRARSEQAAS
jgi:hypothetical protein